MPTGNNERWTHANCFAMCVESQGGIVILFRQMSQTRPPQSGADFTQQLSRPDERVERQK
jgi:hypothetical protein